MRVLIIDCNLRYMNPMRNLLPYYLAQSGDDVVFYGPGYSSGQVLEDGLEKFLQSQESFDIEVRTVQAIPQDEIKSISKSFAKDKIEFYRKCNNFSFPVKDLVSFWSDKSMETVCARSRVLLLHQFDFQVMSEQLKDYLLDGFDMFVGLSGDFWDNHDYSKLNISNAYRHTRCWSDIINFAPSKVLGLPNFVASHEFDFNQHYYRNFDWSVVGTTYNNRKIVKQLFTHNSIKFSSGRTIRYTKLKLLEKAKLYPFKKRRNLDSLNHEFHYTLINSKYSYTCGSDLRMPVRKFFEIPAAGCTLVCTPCIGFKKLGFKDKENSFTCAPEEILDMNHYLSDSPELAQTVSDAGRNLVLRKHTADVRASQLRQGLKLLSQDKYRGSYWSNGDLIFADI